MATTREINEAFAARWAKAWNRRAVRSDMGTVNLRNIDDPTTISGLPIRLLDGASSWKVIDEVYQPHLLNSPGY
jgi:hypothetical protein